MEDCRQLRQGDHAARREARPGGLAALVAVVVLAGLVAPAPAAQPGGRRFVAERSPFTVGQAPDWVDRDTIVWHMPVAPEQGGDGKTQVVTSALDGSRWRCLTCGLPGPNQVAVAQPRGGWILFHSWSNHTVTIGGPGFGGIGSDLWVVRTDGTQATNLTRSSELYDHFHAYWSPNGRWIAWTALNWNQQEGGNGKSDIRVARFEPDGPGGPRLVDEHVVRPGNGHWYETQWWAPDGSGFLYTETVDTAINPELFFCRLRNPARGACQPVRLTHDPAWDEQAIFTKDMDRVIFMSSRDLPGAHQSWARVASLLELPADYDYALVLTVFSDNFLQPVLQQATDFYETTLRWNRARTRFKPGPVRRLTTSGEQGWVIPEFAWDPAGRRLLWTQNRVDGGRRVDQGCVIRELRGAFIQQLSGVDSVAKIPFDLGRTIRNQAAELLRAPTELTYRGACGAAPTTGAIEVERETWIARFED